jgi:hypothetical protein
MGVKDCGWISISLCKMARQYGARRLDGGGVIEHVTVAWVAKAALDHQSKIKRSTLNERSPALSSQGRSALSADEYGVLQSTTTSVACTQ